MIPIIYLYDLSFLILFTLFIVIFLYVKRKNLKKEGLLYLYRTQLGIDFIDWASKKFKRILKFLQFFVIFIGYVLMLVMIYLFLKLAYVFIKFPAFVKAVKIPPLMPLIPYLPELFKIDFLPPFYFTYWIIVIAIIAIPHEFSHGIFARLHGIKVKSTGFGFLGPFLAAFVEPDENNMAKKSKLAQISVLSAGSFANIAVAILFLFITWGFFNLTFIEAGTNFNTYSFSIVNVSDIISLNNKTISNPTFDDLLVEINKKNLTEIELREGEVYILTKEEIKKSLEQKTDKILVYEDAPAIKIGLKGAIIEFNGVKIRNNEQLRKELLKYKPGESAVLKTKLKNEILDYNLVLAENPQNKSRAYLGIANFEIKKSGLFNKMYYALNFFKDDSTYYKPKFNDELMIFIYNLLWWIVIISASVALVNMLPFGIFDGGRVFFLSALAITKSEKLAKALFKYLTLTLILLLILMMFFWFIFVFL